MEKGLVGLFNLTCFEGSRMSCGCTETVQAGSARWFGANEWACWQIVLAFMDELGVQPLFLELGVCRIPQQLMAGE